MSNICNPATLYIVATPIGNLGDITQRAINVLSLVDVIACEDTRHTKKLLSHFNIHNRTIAIHDHNERQMQNTIGELLNQQQSVALVSDAGTPLISDPGFHIVKFCREQGFNVVPIPGCCAAITALCAAGLPTDRFTFEGFLPAKQHARQSKLAELKQETRTMVFYDAPRRAIDTIKDIVTEMGGDRLVVIARELTKTFETIYSDTADNLVQWLSNDANQLKGEMVIIIEGHSVKGAEITPDVQKTLQLLLKELPPKKACAIAAEIYGLKKNTLYSLVLDMKQ